MTKLNVAADWKGIPPSLSVNCLRLSIPTIQNLKLSLFFLLLVSEWQIYLLLLGLFLASAVAFYIFFENSDSFWNFPDPSTRPKIDSILGDSTSDDQNVWGSFGPVDL